MARSGGLASRLYRGEVSYDFIGRRRRWYLASGIVVLVSVLSLLFRGFHESIEFKGGSVFETATHGHSVADARSAVTGVGITPEVVQKVGEGRIRIETAALPTADLGKVQNAIAHRFGESPDDVGITTVGPTWGGQITHKAVEGLIIFLVVVLVYLSLRFEPKMALAAFIALLHDILITAGIYSLVGFEVSPSTVIALLTILGYSLYDTVVVFDKVRENTAGLAGGSRMTFSQAANLAVNQTLVRSINTSIIALLPVAALLFIGAGVLGAGTLKDLALALFIGLASGAYSSIFIATPLLCDAKEREPQFRQLARRVQARQAAPRAAAALATAGAPASATTAGSVAVPPDGPAEPASAPAPATRPARPSRPAAGGTRKPARGRSGRPSGKRRR